MKYAPLTGRFLLYAVIVGMVFLNFPNRQIQASTDEPAPTEEEVLVIYNSAYTTDEDNDLTQDSEQIAEYYQSKRPGVTVQGFDMPVGEEVTWAEYNDEVAEPLQEYLTTNDLEDEIKIIVTVKGVPLKIMGDPGFHDPWDDPECEPFCPVNYAGVDAGISLLYQDFKSLTHGQTNPYYNTDSSFAENNHFKSNYFTTGGFTLRYLVSRLDAYTLDDALAMIDRGVDTDTTSSGYWVLDGAGVPGFSLSAYATANSRLTSFHKNTIYDPYPSALHITTSVHPIMGYSSWGYLDNKGDGYVSNDPSNPNHLDFDLLNGAVFSTWESFNAWGFQDADQHYHGQVGEWISIGGSGGMGNIYEPYSSTIPKEEIWMTAYAVGYPWIEAAYMSLPKLGWVQTVVGDPLMIIADNTNPAPTTGFTAVGQDGAIQLNWTNPVDGDFAGVKVIRKTGSYPTSVTDGTEVYSGSGTSYLNSGLGNGVTYYYAAYAFDTTYNYSAIASDSRASAYAYDSIAPGEVSGLQAVTSTGMASLHWTNPVDADLLRVVLIRKVGSYSTGVGDGTQVYTGTGISYLDVGLSNSTNYYYAAFAQDTSLNYSTLGSGSKLIIAFSQSSGGGGGGGGGGGSSSSPAPTPVSSPVPVPVVVPLPAKNIIAIIEEEKVLLALKFNAVSDFVTNGTGSTLRLGSGERQAAVSSYKDVFGKNPLTASDWTDVLNIANGRWPLGINKSAEARGYLNFATVYGRKADMKNSTDVNALKMMIYGVRSTQLRNLTVEASAIAKFTALFGFKPLTPRQWNIVRALAYSGVRK